MRALFSGPGALRLLRAGGRGEVVLAGRQGAYARLGDEHLHLCAVDGPFGPLSVAVTPWPLARPGDEVVIGGGELRIGDEVARVDRVRLRGRAPAPVAPRAGAVRLAEWLPALPLALAAGMRALEAGDLAAAVAALAGRGAGLTPDGDDVLAGYAAWRYATGKPVRLAEAAAGLASPLGLSYLRCAERGELPEAAAQMLAALVAGDRAAAVSALPALRRWGSSSGAALAHGMVAGRSTAVAATRRAPHSASRSGVSARAAASR
jgi:hypothetical protein